MSYVYNEESWVSLSKPRRFEKNKVRDENPSHLTPQSSVICIYSFMEMVNNKNTNRHGFSVRRKDSLIFTYS